MWGAYLTIGGVAVRLGVVGFSPLRGGFAVVYAMIGTAAVGYVIGRTVVLPLAGQRSLAMLIATIGVAIVLEEVMRVAERQPRAPASARSWRGR